MLGTRQGRDPPPHLALYDAVCSVRPAFSQAPSSQLRTAPPAQPFPRPTAPPPAIGGEEAAPLERERRGEGAKCSLLPDALRCAFAAPLARQGESSPPCGSPPPAPGSLDATEAKEEAPAVGRRGGAPPSKNCLAGSRDRKREPCDCFEGPTGGTPEQRLTPLKGRENSGQSRVSTLQL